MDDATSPPILRVAGGSRAYGLAVDGSDLDVRGVFLPRVAWLCGLPPSDRALTIEHTFTPPNGARVDIVMHALPKFVRLALAANPNILEILWCRDEDILLSTRAGRDLRAMRRAVLSRRCRDTFVGYAKSQLGGERAHSSRHGTRAEAVDWKNAMHLVRLLRTGLEALRTGDVRVWRQDRADLLAIRRGDMPETDLRAMAESMMRECDDAVRSSPLPEEPDYRRVEDWLIYTQARWVAGDQTLLERA